MIVTTCCYPDHNICWLTDCQHSRYLVSLTKKSPEMADQTSGSFSAGTAAVYIFNLIVGTGALALPAAFAMAGWASATVLLLLLALLSYITASWVVETMAACNAIITIQDRLHSQQIRDTSNYK